MLPSGPALLTSAFQCARPLAVTCRSGGSLIHPYDLSQIAAKKLQTNTGLKPALCNRRRLHLHQITDLSRARPMKSGTRGSALIRLSLRIVLLLSCVAGCSLAAQSAEIVFLSNFHDQTTLQQQEETAARNYGLTTMAFQVEGEKSALRATRAIRQKTTLGVVVSAGALESLNKRRLFSA